MVGFDDFERGYFSTRPKSASAAQSMPPVPRLRERRQNRNPLNKEALIT
jgi:hypothetical protein